MNEPPDPGGFIPPVASYVTISNESGMDTDASTTTRSLKRGRRHICKHCNKRRRKQNSSELRPNDCNCNDLGHVESNQPINTELKAQRIVNTESILPVSTPTPVGRNVYEKTDTAPYIVHVQKILTSPDDASSMHPITFGKFLKRYSFENIINGSVKKIGRNKISLAFSNYNNANSFIAHKSLETSNLKAFIPTFNVTRMGLVRGIPSEWSPDEIKQNISVPIGCGDIIKVRRLNFKTFVDGTPTWKPSQTVVVTFDGQILPKRVFCCYNSLNVDLYIYPTIQCYNCCRFGHTKLQCRSKPRCFKCGQEHSGESCGVLKESASCCLCSGHHFANNKICPEYLRQTQIKSYMAQNCVSYIEASKLHPAVSKSFADIVSSPPLKSVRTNNMHVNNNSFPSTSYKKSVPLKHKPHSPLPKGYNKASHDAAVNQFSMASFNSENGCVLNYNKTNEQSDQQLSNEFVYALLNLLSQYNIALPTNAANLNAIKIHTSKNGQDNPMELPERD